MWHNAIRSTNQIVTDALFREAILPPEAEAFERLSAAMAVRTALLARAATPQCLLFMVPEATASTARHIAAGLLIGNYAHSSYAHAANGGQLMPTHEQRELLKSDILLVSPSISACRESLEVLEVGADRKLKDFWTVAPLSQFVQRTSAKPRVYLANPGRLKAGQGRRFSAIIIDASHPRTYTELPDLLASASMRTYLRVVVAPVMNDADLRRCGWPKSTSLWVWDPSARHEAQQLVNPKETIMPTVSERDVVVCDSDTEADGVLARLHDQLVSIGKACVGRAYPGLAPSWSIYHRLRQLAVPLAELDQLAAESWGGSLKQRIKSLEEVQGHGDVIWDTTWLQLKTAVEEAYQVLLRRMELAKFQAVVERITSVLFSGQSLLRVVVPTDVERDLLLRKIVAAIPGADGAIANGRLEIVNPTAEARLIAEGDRAPTILLGPRPTKFRYLDAFASQRIEVLAYPHEVKIEQGALARVYGDWMEATADAARLQLLEPLGLRVRKTVEPPRPRHPRPRAKITGAERHAVSEIADGLTLSGLDLDALTGDGASPSEGSHAMRKSEGESAGVGDAVELVLENGTTSRFYAHESIDVFFPESETLQRRIVGEVEPGWQVVTFVDSGYDSLYSRLTEVVNSRLAAKERITLGLWSAAKEELLRRFRVKARLHEHLQQKGLTSSRETMSAWFDGEYGALAPQQYEEFVIVAKECKTFADAPKLLRPTFDAVQRERGRNRARGRVLRRFLRAVATGHEYDEALESASKIHAGLGDVLAAVEIGKVQSVRVIPRSV